MGLFLHIFFQYQIRGFFWLESFFAIKIKRCACTRSKKFCLIENFTEWKTAFKFPYDTNITLQILHRNITLKYMSYIRSNRCLV